MMAMLRVHRVNRPLIVGETLLVPVVTVFGDEGAPVFWPPHRDKSDGQQELHYHVDPRFLPDPGGYVIAGGIKCRSIDHGPRRADVVGRKMRWLPMVVLRTEVPRDSRTPVAMIEKAIKEVSCNALRNGKCPHRGFNMAQVLPDEYGVKTCPMHGMRFWAHSGKGIPYPKGGVEGEPPPSMTEEKLWLRG